MDPIQLFSLASRQAEWLSVRQEVVASNIANANTPEFRAKDITPFQAVLDNTQSMAMARTQAGHMSAANGIAGADDIEVREADLNQEIGVQESGNTVSLAEELSKTGEIKREFQLNANLVSSFHRMMLQTVKR